MKLLPALVLVGLSASTLSSAQFVSSVEQAQGQSAAPATSSTDAALRAQVAAQVAALQAQACPVSMTAKQAGATELVWAQKGENPKPEPPGKPGQRIRLFLSGLTESGKVTATVTVRGLSARGRVDKAAASDASDVRRTMNVTLTRGDDKTMWAELVLPGFTAVKSVKLEALEFADGSTRDLAGKSMCTVEPDPLMLIAGR